MGKKYEKTHPKCVTSHKIVNKYLYETNSRPNLDHTYAINILGGVANTRKNKYSLVAWSLW